jgi:hypothetical protein
MEIFDFPALRVSKQVFHVPGQAVDGGFTSGAVRILSPEPGGRSVLELQIALQVGEWDNPESSWLMSKGNGEVFRVRLAPTPQVLSARSAQPDWRSNALWSEQKPVSTDMVARYDAVALEGSTTLVVDMTAHGDRIRRGHVIGHGDTCYGIDKVIYNHTTHRATLTVKPPLRNPVAVGDTVLFRPYFTGVMGNIEELRTTYDAEQVGAIQLGKIVFTEAIV